MMGDGATLPDRPPADEPAGDAAPEETPAAAPPPPEEGAATEAAPAPVLAAERQALKLVVVCRPEGDGYRVALGVGADGCDPVFRHTTAEGLVTALDEVPALLAAAEEQWRVQPRYPSAKPRAASARPRTDNADRPRSEAAAPAAPAAKHAPAAKAAPAGQMALFG